MIEEKSLDLSQVSVANLLNNDAPTSIPEPETLETEEPVVEATSEEESQEPVAEAKDSESSSIEETETEGTEETEDLESSEEAAPEEPGVIDTLRQKFGYEIEGKFEDDYDGVVGFTQQVAQMVAKEQLDTVFSQFPDVEQYLQFRYNGGDPKRYFQATSPEIDFGAVELAEEDISTQRMVVQEHLLKQGYTNEEVSETVQEYLDAGILQRQANRSLGKLKSLQEKEASTLIESQKAEAEQRQAQLHQQWDSIKTTIDTGKLKTFEIPSADKNKFYSWMSDSVDNHGRTQRVIDREQMDLETQLAIEYLAWKKLDLSRLVSATQNTKKAQNLKQKLQKTQTASRRMKGGVNSSQKAPQKLPSLKELL